MRWYSNKDISYFTFETWHYVFHIDWQVLCKLKLPTLCQYHSNKLCILSSGTWNMKTFREALILILVLKHELDCQLFSNALSWSSNDYGNHDDDKADTQRQEFCVWQNLCIKINLFYLFSYWYNSQNLQVLSKAQKSECQVNLYLFQGRLRKAEVERGRRKQRRRSFWRRCCIFPHFF